MKRAGVGSQRSLGRFPGRVLVCLAVLLGAGAFLFGTQPAQGEATRSEGWDRFRQTVAVPFCLAPGKAGLGGFGPAGPGPLLSLDRSPAGASPRLRDDHPRFNRKSSLAAVGLRVVATNALIWTVNRLMFNYPWSHSGPASWKNNLRDGWEWDTDRFGMNFFFHPYSGSTYYSSARANGYAYLESVPFVFLGSLMWEYFGETTRPAYNDLINTTLSGAMFGEILYRLSSNILDDRKRGAERLLRELVAAVICPARAFSRLVHGKLDRSTTREIYQKEPLYLTLTAGGHWLNRKTAFATGSPSGIVGLRLDYGDPYDTRPRKPFDFFNLRVDFNTGRDVGRKYLKNVTGYGLLFGRTSHAGKTDLLVGAFQHYDYWDNSLFQIATLSFGGGAVARWSLPGHSHFQSAVHLGLIPLGASHSPYVDFVEQGVHLRNYDYSGGAVAKLEGMLTLDRLGRLGATYDLFWLHTWVGPAGDKVIGIFRPRVTARLSEHLSLGLEYTLYHKASALRDYPDVYQSNSEQKLYLQLTF